MAREYQVYSLFQEMMPALKSLDTDGKETLKSIAFNKALMRAIKDQRKFIQDIRGLIKDNTYTAYFEEQKKIGSEITEKLSNAEIRSKENVDRFAQENVGLTDRLKESIERALLRSRSQQLKNKPSENVTKSIDLLMDVDPRLFGKLSKEEKETLKAELQELERIVISFRKQLEK